MSEVNSENTCLGSGCCVYQQKYPQPEAKCPHCLVNITSAPSTLPLTSSCRGKASCLTCCGWHPQRALLRYSSIPSPQNFSPWTPHATLKLLSFTGSHFAILTSMQKGKENQDVLFGAAVTAKEAVKQGNTHLWLPSQSAHDLQPDHVSRTTLSTRAQSSLLFRALTIFLLPVPFACPLSKLRKPESHRCEGSATI